MPLVAGSGLDNGADAKALRAWLQSEYSLTAATAASVADLYLPEAKAVATAAASQAYVAGEWAETDQSMWCGARRTAHTHASDEAHAEAPAETHASVTPPRPDSADAAPVARVGAARSASAFLYRFARGVGGAQMVHHSDDIPFWFDARAAP